MKLKKIEKLCKERKNILVIREVDEMGLLRTFIGDGSAAYEVQGFEDVLGSDLLLTIFDVKQEDRADWTTNVLGIENDNKSTANIMPEDREAERIGPKIVYRGEEIEAYHSAGALIWINAKYWAPLRDELKKGEIHVYVREGVNGLIIKSGMGITIACIGAYETYDEDRMENGIKALWEKICAKSGRAFRSVAEGNEGQGK